MLDWIGAALELGGAWTVGDKKRFGFLLLLGCNIAWLGHVVMEGVSYGLLLVVIPAAYINIRNFIKWGRENGAIDKGI